jgi:hypothetical protein
MRNFRLYFSDRKNRLSQLGGRLMQSKVARAVEFNYDGENDFVTGTLNPGSSSNSSCTLYMRQAGWAIFIWH